VSAALRLAGCLLFVPLAIPFIVVAPLAILAAGLRWIAHGPDEAATDRILLNPALCWADDLPLLLFQVADRRRAT
jgi:hypothetical protein